MPEEPKEALHVPVIAVLQNQPEGVQQQLLLTRGALVVAELVGRPGPPGELGEPRGGRPVTVVGHRRAELLGRPAEPSHVARIGMQGGGVEVVLCPGYPIEVVEEVPSRDVPVGGHSCEHDLGLRGPAFDRVVGDLKQPRVLLDRLVGRCPRREIFLQIGLVPDLPGLDRQRDRVVSEPLAVAVGPVAAAGPVARHRRPEEVLPCLYVDRRAERGTRGGPSAHPLRRPPHERGRSDSARGKRADQPVPWAPVGSEPRVRSTDLHLSMKRSVRTPTSAIC